MTNQYKYNNKLEIANQKIKILEQMIEDRTLSLYLANNELENKVKSRTQELNKANKSLSQKNNELEQFTYLASHDLKAPLTTIKGFAELIESKYKGQLDDDADTYLKFISSSASRMSSLINSLLSYSHLGRPSEKTLVNLNLLTHIVLNDLSSLINKTKPIIKIGNLPQFFGHKTELRSLFQNIISNAIKFRKKNNTVIIQISSKKEGSHWIFSFKDNGIGFIVKDQDEIFKMFSQLNKNKYEGSGIGLAHCQKIVNLHDGKIWAESEPQIGTTFYITMPIIKEKNKINVDNN